MLHVGRQPTSIRVRWLSELIEEAFNLGEMGGHNTLEKMKQVLSIGRLCVDELRDHQKCLCHQMTVFTLLILAILKPKAPPA